MFYVFLLYALFASVFTIGKSGLSYAQPFFFVGSRMTMAGILILIYQYFFNYKNFKLEKKHIWKILQLAIFNIYFTNVFEFWGLKYLTSFKTCFIYNLSPFVSALLSYFIFKEKISFKKGLGLAIGFTGFLPIFLTQTSIEETTGQFFFFSWAEMAVMLAVFCSVYGWILLKQLVKENNYSPFMANGLSMFFGGIMALGHSAAIETWNPFPVVSYVSFFECAIALIIISNFIAYNLYGHLLKTFSATFVSIVGFSTPIFTAFFGWLFLGEVVTWPFYASVIIVFAGIFLFYQEELKAGYYVPVETEIKT
jgi:drug/metabolite transporter (DMT)-like permease